MKEKRQNRKLAILLAALALVIVLAVGPVRESLAYFTYHDDYSGNYVIHYDSIKTKIIERLDGRNKHVTLENIGEEPCFVRVKAFCNHSIALKVSGVYWQLEDDGYYYYNNYLEPGEQTSELLVEITYPEGYAQDYNVVIVQECAPVAYDASGTAYGDWDLTIAQEVTA